MMVLMTLLLAAGDVHRVAIVVGANAAPAGRKALRYAYDDADRMADTLRRVGGFADNNITVLHDPTPRELLASIDDARKALTTHTSETLLLFYYSGHADPQALYPHGEAASLAELRDALERVPATVRVGLLDACRGGGWTQAKGLNASAPIDVPFPSQLQSEGSIFIASSSGLENAHEADILRASFFTHHLVGALLGAGDRSGDGQVTLGEAYDYARELTIRDTARYASEPQHPSFDVNLRGRQDLALAQLSSSSSVVNLVQDEGPLEVIHLGTGLVMLEVPQGKATLKLALPPGTYLVRQRVGDSVMAKEIKVRASQSVEVREADLELVGSAQLALKGDFDLPRILDISTRKRVVEIRTGFGLGSLGTAASSGLGLSVGSLNGSFGPEKERNFTFILLGTWGLTERLSWLIASAAFAYRLGNPTDRVEGVIRGGIPTWGVGSGTGSGTFWRLGLNLGGDIRLRLKPNHYLIGNLDLGSAFGSLPEGGGFSPPTTWRMGGSVGYSVLIKDVVSINLGVAFSGNLLTDGHFPRKPFIDSERELMLTFGSVQSLGYRPLPLLQVHVLKWLSLDLHVTLGTEVRTRRFIDRYLLGATFSF